MSTKINIKNIFVVARSTAGEFLKIIKSSAVNRSKMPFLKRLKLWRFYFKFTLKDFVLGKIFRYKITSENFLGYRVFFPSYPIFRFLFTEIFLQEDYYFKSQKLNPVIVDCGANFGMAVIFFKYFYPNAEVVAFEPDREVFSFLENNVERNKFNNVKLYNFALSDKEGDMTIYSNNTDALFATGVVSLPARERLFARIVLGVCLSRFLKGEVDFLKVDIEGFEEKVVSDLAHKNKLNMIKEMCIEYHRVIGGVKREIDGILNFLGKNNFNYVVQNNSKNNSLIRATKQA